MNAGESVYWEVWECDSTGNYGSNFHGYGCFFWYDYNQGTAFQPPPYQIPSGATFTGVTCEAIVERDQDCGNYCALSKWSGAISMPFDCLDFGLMTVYNVSTDPYFSYRMMSGGRNLATPGKANPDIATATWVRAQ